MLKFTSYVASVALCISAFFIVSCSSFSCVHDRVDVKKIPSLLVTRSTKYSDIREQRERERRHFEPLNVYFYIENVENSLTVDAIYNIHLALENVTKKLNALFEVRERKKPFLLPRSMCVQRWQSGKNRGKCSKFKNINETCSMTGVVHEIPARFLDKMEVYEFDNPRPHFIAEAGVGLQESNFITFIISEASGLCEGTDAAAYGSYCRLDPKTNEPIAGILNLCPAYFSKKVYSLEHYYHVILHEMFHILGFAKNLFEKFVPCRKGIYCDVPRVLVQEDSNGIHRMMYPLVIKNMQEHFNCSNPDFGGPMDYKPSDSNNSLDEADYTSHWHSVLMHSSIMSSSFTEFDSLFIDNITLAVFGSTGWYNINYSKADVFIFGKGQGCDFGNSCDNKFLCDPDSSTTGCDLVHKGIGTCTNFESNYTCGVYAPTSLEDCSRSMDKNYAFNSYSLGYKHKCFMTDEGNISSEQNCLPVKCKSEEDYEIMINTTWYSCDSESIKVNDTSVFCPESFLFCSGSKKEPVAHLCPPGNFFIAVRLLFSLPAFTDLSKFNNFANFKVTTLRGIAEKIDIPVNFIVNSSLSVFKKLYLDFFICPPKDENTEDLDKILKRVQTFLDDGSYTHILKAPEDMIISTSLITIDPLETIAFSDYEGFRALIVFPFLCAVFIVATCLASIPRMVSIQKQRPQRYRTKPSEENVELSDVSTPS